MRLLPPREHATLPLTKRQRAILSYITAVHRAQGRAPSARVIAWRFHVSLQTVQDHLQALYRKGWLRTPTPDGLFCDHSPSAETP
jgi:SOS-response transcriptional repressor LexA